MQIYQGELETLDSKRSQKKGRSGGTVNLKRFEDLPTDELRVFALHFPPGNHTAWHVHAGRQVMYAIFGRGCVQVEGEPARILNPGDVAYLDPGVKHWHGAAPEGDFIHTVIAFDKKTYWEFRTKTGSMKRAPVSQRVYQAAFK